MWIIDHLLTPENTAKWHFEVLLRLLLPEAKHSEWQLVIKHDCLIQTVIKCKCIKNYFDLVIHLKMSKVLKYKYVPYKHISPQPFPFKQGSVV